MMRAERCCSGRAWRAATRRRRSSRRSATITGSTPPGSRSSGWSGGVRGAADAVNTAVVGDAVEPRPHRDVALARAEPVVGALEDVLDDVLGVGGGRGACGA